MRAILALVSLVMAANALAGDLLYSAGVGTDTTPRYFDATLPGLHAYLVELEKADPKTAAGLRPLWVDLRDRDERAVSAAAVQGFAGGFLFVGSFSFLRPRVSDENGTHYEMSAPAAIVGVAFMVTAFIVYDWLSPGRTDLLSFINEHNRLAPQAPLRYQLDPTVAPLHESGLSLRF